MVASKKELERARIEGAINELLLLHWIMWISAFNSDGKEVRSLTVDDLAREGEVDTAIHARLHLKADSDYRLHWCKVEDENILDGDHYNVLTLALAQKVKDLHALDSEPE